MINCNEYNNMFSDMSNIKYINLKNIKNDNDKIISQFFYSKDGLYVCQSETILTNPNIYNCCDYNYQSNKCNLNTDSDSSEGIINTQSPIIINDTQTNNEQDNPDEG